ncbi:pectate lyase [Actinoplanes sp. TRM 88003]|uniref:Pectate lyase n=1 Tax=Paractinoplanes aksuensis TaxID=2939490 RepID=A0ABT1DPT8_9ACTN|nr:pectate lyase [Actinoplanes aksuensis]MCO8271766.1 pectate lyase [Actinoplanes aksuensis]
MTSAPARYVHLDGETAELTNRLIALATRGLPAMYRAESDEFAFTRVFTPGNAGFSAHLSGKSLRYAAIVALGVGWLPSAEQPALLGGHDLDSFVARLVEQQSTSTNLGDIALVVWAAAQTSHRLLPDALLRLSEFDRRTAPEYVVEAAWVVSALATARGQADVEEHLAQARKRLLDSVRPGSPVFPHVTGPGLVKPYREHVACFADQVYPIQALARLHHSGADKEALDAARTTAEQICRLQGPDGQWWWFYDARTGDVVEGYPVYTVHQHAMGPMALLDLAEAGGGDYAEPIRKGLRWLLGPAELGPGGEPMLLDEPGLTVRKVFRGDPRKIVRAAHTLTTKVRPGLKLPLVDRVYKPADLDRECRPYEFGWLYFAWLASLNAPAKQATAESAGR